MEPNAVSESMAHRRPQRVPSSRFRFRGVSLLRSGKWSARIYYMNRPCMLGTYQLEEEAAVAFDRASVKLQRGDAKLNFDWTEYNNEERVFQSLYSTEDILKMLHDTSYSSRLVSFLLRNSSGMRTQSTAFMDEQGIPYHLLFQKDLTHRDFTNECFLVPSEISLRYFPLPETIINSGERADHIARYVDLSFYDKHGRSWMFRYSYLRATQCLMFTNGWGYFIMMNNLKPKDTVMFYRCEYKGEVPRREFYMIYFCSDYGKRTLFGRNIEWLGGNINMELGADGMKEETKKGFKLFGVQITG